MFRVSLWVHLDLLGFRFPGHIMGLWGSGFAASLDWFLICFMRFCQELKPGLKDFFPFFCR